jgi:mannose/fructose/N-acetylgalactosamine-specific phosphotransferase system component IID
LLEDGSSLLGLVVVIAMIAYALRGRSQPPVMPRPLSKSERRIWVLSYALAALAFTMGFDLLARVSGSHLQSVGAQVNIAAIAVLRGLVLSLVGVSLCLNVRLHNKISQLNQ